MHAQIHTHTYTYTHMHTHTHIHLRHTDTHTHTLWHTYRVSYASLSTGAWFNAALTLTWEYRVWHSSPHARQSGRCWVSSVWMAHQQTAHTKHSDYYESAWYLIAHPMTIQLSRTPMIDGTNPTTRKLSFSTANKQGYNLHRSNLLAIMKWCTLY